MTRSKLGPLDEAAAARRLDGDLEQRLDAFFADATAPARQARRIDRRTRLQVRLAGEVLPVRVLHPGVDHRLVGGREGVLQVQQPRHQPGRQRRAAARGREVQRRSCARSAPSRSARPAEPADGRDRSARPAVAAAAGSAKVSSAWAPSSTSSQIAGNLPLAQRYRANQTAGKWRKY